MMPVVRPHRRMLGHADYLPVRQRDHSNVLGGSRSEWSIRYREKMLATWRLGDIVAFDMCHVTRYIFP